MTPCQYMQYTLFLTLCQYCIPKIYRMLKAAGILNGPPIAGQHDILITIRGIQMPHRSSFAPAMILPGIFDEILCSGHRLDQRRSIVPADRQLFQFVQRYCTVLFSDEGYSRAACAGQAIMTCCVCIRGCVKKRTDLPQDRGSSDWKRLRLSVAVRVKPIPQLHGKD